MRYILLFVLFALFIGAGHSFSQEHDKKTEDEEKQKSSFMEKIQPVINVFFSPVKKQYILAEADIIDGNFPKALKIYKELLSKDPDNANFNFKVGFCCLNIAHEKLESISYLEKAVKSTSEKYKENSFKEKNAPVDAYFFLGKSYHLAYRFEDAINTFKNLKSKISGDDTKFINKINREIKMCNNGIELIKYPVNFKVENINENINSEYSEHSPVFFADESVLIFT